MIAGMNDEDVFAIQRFYPQIYLACHADHIRASSTKWRLSSHDSSILAHLDGAHGMSPRDLQRHLGVAPSSLSASLKRLAGLGYITNKPAVDDKRKREIRLTALGMEAMQETSVLDTAKLGDILGRLSPDERRDAVRGLQILANAARQFEEEAGS
jgi:DNA-binding MarR family transcriptional regulator